MRMKTMGSEEEARDLMRDRNRTRRGKTDLSVVVEGPDDGQWTVMDLRDAIESGFSYSWEV